MDDFCLLKERHLHYPYVIWKSEAQLKPRVGWSEVQEPLAGHRDPNLLCRPVSSESLLNAWWPEGTSNLYKTQPSRECARHFKGWEEAERSGLLGGKECRLPQELLSLGSFHRACGCNGASTCRSLWALTTPVHTDRSTCVTDNQKLQCLALGKTKVRV